MRSERVTIVRVERLRIDSPSSVPMTVITPYEMEAHGVQWIVRGLNISPCKFATVKKGAAGFPRWSHQKKVCNIKR
jgi:hypothetical protein